MLPTYPHDEDNSAFSNEQCKYWTKWTEWIFTFVADWGIVFVIGIVVIGLAVGGMIGKWLVK